MSHNKMDIQNLNSIQSLGEMKIDNQVLMGLQQVELCNQVISDLDCNIDDKAASAQMIKAFLDALYTQIDTLYLSLGRPKRQAAQIAQSIYEAIFNTLSPATKSAVTKLDDAYSYIKKKYGYWTGEAGNSKFVISPDVYDMILPDGNSHFNPLQKTIRQIIAENNIDGIEYKGYEPQFEAIAKAKVVLKGQTFYRYEADVPCYMKGEQSVSVHERAFEQLAEQKGWTKEQAYKYKEENHLMWHECWDCETILLVPVEIHALFGHLGGVSIAKSILE